VSALVLKGGRPLGQDRQDMAVMDGRLCRLDELSGDRAVRAVDCTDLIILPGLVDLHTHLREPGQRDAETVTTGTRAAARGGFTAVCAMANTDPVADNSSVVERVAALGAEAGHCDVVPVGAVTVGLAGQQLADIPGMAASQARVRVFSDDGKCVDNSALMREALIAVRGVGGVLAQHAQDPLLTPGAQLNEGVVSRELGMPGWPAVAEEAVIARDCLLAHHLGARLHVCHVSTAGSVEVIRWAKSPGWPVTAEVTPHHLMLTDEMARTGDPTYKVNPPLRTARDVQALRFGLADGTIDVVATDHAPHTPAAKAHAWCEAPMGMLGLETALSVVADAMISSGMLTWAEVADRMSARPARIAGIDDYQGTLLEPGGPANLCLVDPASTWSVDPDGLASLSRNTPFPGAAFTTRVVATMLRGRVTHDLNGLFH